MCGTGDTGAHISTDVRGTARQVAAKHSYLRLVDGVLVTVEENEITGAAPHERRLRGSPHPAHQPPGATNLRPRRVESIHVLRYFHCLWKSK